MAQIKRKELDKFLKDNPESPAAQAIMEQLGEPAKSETRNGILEEVSTSPGQIRNSDSYLAAEKINELHRGILDGINEIFTKAIEIGEILLKQKESLEHGQWLDWIDNQLDIGPRQVQNYIRIYNQRREVGFAMKELAESGLKPSLRKMLEVATKKDHQTSEKFIQNRHQDTSNLSAKERKQRRLVEKREKEISTLAKLCLDKDIDDNALAALVTKWNMDNQDNTMIYMEDVKKTVRETEQELYPDIFRPTPIKNNITISIDSDIWDSFVNFGGGVAYLEEYLNEYLTTYVNEQRAYCIAN